MTAFVRDLNASLPLAADLLPFDKPALHRNRPGFISRARPARLIAAMVFGLVLCTQYLPAQTVIRFTAPPTFPVFPTGSAGRQLSSGDLDGDGDLDLVAVSSTKIIALISDGTGYTATASLPVTGSLIEVAVGDVNSDGFSDVVVLTSFRAEIFLGSASGELVVGDVIDLLFPRGVAVGDIDGDGDLDLAISEYYEDRIRLWANDGLGTFAEQSTINWIAPTDIEFGDLDDDGDLDLVFVHTATAIVSFVGDGFGNFTFSYIHTFPVFFGPRSITLTDFNNNGVLDAVAVMVLGEIRLAEGIGDGTFGNQFLLVEDATTALVGDVDNDGDVDLVTTVNRAAYEVWLNDGFGSVTRDNFGAPSGRNHLVDLDDDGILDLAVGNGSSGFRTISTLRGLGDGSFESPSLLPSDTPTGLGATVSRAFLADLNDDGLLDPTGKANSGIAIHPNSGAGTFAAPEFIDLSPSTTVNAFDITGDDAPDLIGGGDGLALREWSAPLAFLSPIESSTITVINQSWVVDLDGDGSLDFVTVESSPHRVARYSSVALTEPGPASGQTLLIGVPAGGLSFGDLDLDGKLDLFTFYQDSLNVYESTEPSGYDLSHSIEFSDTVRAITSADFDTDGRADVVVCLDNGELHLLRGSVGGVLIPDQVQMVEAVPTDALGADLNGDGLPDLLLGTQAEVRFYRNTGSNFVLESIVPGVGSRLYADQLGDLDLDGDLDLVLPAAGGAGIQVHFNESFIDCNGNGVPDARDLAAGTSSDSDGDGVLDECEPFLRGDTSNDSAVDITDAVGLLESLFLGATLDCLASADTNNDDAVDISDAAFLLNFLFVIGSAPPPAPYPNCGIGDGPSTIPCLRSACP